MIHFFTVKEAENKMPALILETVDRVAERVSVPNGEAS